MKFLNRQVHNDKKYVGDCQGLEGGGLGMTLNSNMGENLHCFFDGGMNILKLSGGNFLTLENITVINQ